MADLNLYLDINPEFDGWAAWVASGNWYCGSDEDVHVTVEVDCNRKGVVTASARVGDSEPFSTCVMGRVRQGRV